MAFAQTKVTKSVWYKKAMITAQSPTCIGLSLQELLEKALAKKQTPKDRKQVKKDDRCIVINSKTKLGKIICGQMIQYLPGQDPVIVKLDDTIDEYPVEALALGPDDNDIKREVVNSVVYFLVYENHVVIAQSNVLRTKDFENHLNWLLYEAGLFDLGDGVILSDKPTPATWEKINKSPVKAVRFGSDIQTEQIPNSEITDKTKTFRIKDKRQLSILRDILKLDWLTEQNALSDAFDDANLKLSIELTYSRSTTPAAHKMIDSIATAMRHSDPDDTTVELEGGAKIVGDELKMTAKLSGITMINGLIVATSMYEAMEQWLTSQIKAKII